MGVRPAMHGPPPPGVYRPFPGLWPGVSTKKPMNVPGRESLELWLCPHKSPSNTDADVAPQSFWGPLCLPGSTLSPQPSAVLGRIYSEV